MLNSVHLNFSLFSTTDFPLSDTDHDKKLLPTFLPHLPHLRFNPRLYYQIYLTFVLPPVCTIKSASFIFSVLRHICLTSSRFLSTAIYYKTFSCSASCFVRVGARAYVEEGNMTLSLCLFPSPRGHLLPFLSTTLRALRRARSFPTSLIRNTDVYSLFCLVVSILFVVPWLS